MENEYFELSRTKRQRRCSYCRGTIAAKEKFFSYTRWIEEQPYPDTKNCCLECAKDFASEEFIVYLANLINAVQGLKEQAERIDYGDCREID